ncbi:MAG: fatty acid--CoA ligase, partial [Proteobacteria bacterium]|nr:fatty acid--CoA ligase [Pseudomonadota bacterium]
MKEPRIINRTPSAYAYPLLIKQLLHTPIHFAPDQEIVYRDLWRYTYKDLYRRIHQLAGALSDLGVGPGDTVAVMDWDSPRYLECFFAIPMMGAILHTVNIRLSPEQILYTMNHAQDNVVLVHEDFLPILEEVSDRIETVDRFILLKDGPDEPSTTIPLAGEYEALLAGRSGEFDFPEFDENAQATTFYTTGTTGDPKGVYFSHRQLVLHTLTAATVMGGFRPSRLRAGDVYMPVTPMFHVHAWGIPYVATMLGVKQVYPGRYEPDRLLNLVDREGVTFSHCVPTILHMMLSSPLAEKLDLSRWTVNVGGAAFPRGLARAAVDKGLKVYAGYGMSETGPILTVAFLKPEMLDWDVENQLDVQLKAGFPIPLVDLRVVDDSGRPLPRDGRSAGEIVVRAPWLTQGYFRQPDRSEELWAGGWLHTGDIATVDERGYIQITDRLKDVIKSGGEWISSLELENLISQHPAVSEAAVVGMADEKWGERPAALVVLKPERADGIDGEAIRGFLGRFVEEGRISRWAVPVWV